MKYKLDAIKRIRANQVDTNKVACFLNTNDDSSVRRAYLNRLISALSESDVYISVMSDLMLEKDWESVCGEYGTPTDGSWQRNFHEKVRSFSEAFIALSNNVTKKDFKMILFHVDARVIFAKSKNMKFLLLVLMEMSESDTLMHFIRRIRAADAKKNYYLVYLVSLIVRYRASARLSAIAIDFFVSFVQGLEMAKTTHFVLSAQLLLYLCCFKPEVEERTRDFVKRVFDNGYAKNMNKIVVEIFCDEFDYKRPRFFSTLDAEVLCFFPLDPPTIPRIKIRFDESYVEWTSRK